MKGIDPNSGTYAFSFASPVTRMAVNLLISGLKSLRKETVIAVALYAAAYFSSKAAIRFSYEYMYAMVIVPQAASFLTLCCHTCEFNVNQSAGRILTGSQLLAATSASPSFGNYHSIPGVSEVHIMARPLHTRTTFHRIFFFSGTFRHPSLFLLVAFPVLVLPVVLYPIWAESLLESCECNAAQLLLCLLPLGVLYSVLATLRLIFWQPSLHAIEISLTVVQYIGISVLQVLILLLTMFSGLYLIQEIGTLSYLIVLNTLKIIEEISNYIILGNPINLDQLCHHVLDVFSMLWYLFAVTIDNGIQNDNSTQVDTNDFEDEAALVEFRGES
eukprot:IDg4590t1